MCIVQRTLHRHTFGLTDCRLVSNSKVNNKCTAIRKVATPLRELTCHMGSHSVTCHPAELTFPPLPAEAGTRFSDPGGMHG